MPSRAKLLIALFALACLAPTLAQGPLPGEWQEVRSPRTSVLFEDPRLEEYALEVAARAEAALTELADLFGSVPPLTTIELDGNTDLYTAIAPPLPRPRVVLPALFPAVPQVDLRTSDPLYALLLHELTHTVQLGYLVRPAGVPRLPRLGLLGEAVAPLPPGWLLEGLAVWVASSRAPGATVVDARTRGVLEALALEGEWPSLEDVSLLSHSRWPGGEARYLLGGAFVANLVERHGWESLLSALREANAGWYPLPFETAWRRATGTQLEEEWRRWSLDVEERALARVRDQQLAPATRLTKHGRASEVVALNPDGSRLAWRPAGGGLLVSPLLTGTGGAVTLGAPERVLPPHESPRDLSWAGPEQLLYTRLAPGPDDRFTYLFQLDLQTGHERRLDFAPRARFSRVGPGGCLWYVRDVIGERSTLWQQCDAASPVSLFRAAAGTHILGLAVSSRGQVALSIWRGGFVDLALLESGGLRWLTQDSAQDLDPAWQGEEELLFRSDRSGVFELYALRPGEERIRWLTTELGGAFAPSSGRDRIVYARLGGEGIDLATIPSDQTAGYRELVFEPLPDAPRFDGDFRIREYSPLESLAPFGWLPALELIDLDTVSLAPSIAILGQDRSGDHSYSLSAGFDPTLSGPAGGAWASLRYEFRATDAFDLFQRPPPSGFGVQLGLWPHHPHLRAASETAAGMRVELWSRTRLEAWAGLLRLRAGALHLPSFGGLQPEGRLDLVASRRFNDLWGYGSTGPRLSAHLLWSADPSGGSGGAWFDASEVVPAGRQMPFTSFYSLRAGYRPLRPAPLPVGDWVAFAGIGGRRSLPVEWRYADGLLALERLTMEVRVHAAFDGHLAGAADLSLWADTMIRYGAPVSVGGTVGYAGDWWYRLGLRLPL